MKLPSIQQVYREASRAVRRFPFVLFCALAFVLTALIIMEAESRPRPSIVFPIVLGAALGVPLLTALALCAEKRKWSPGLSTGIQLLGVLMLVGYSFTVPTNLPQEPASHFIRFALLAAGLVLLVMIAPYLKRGEVNGFWQYNKTLYFRLFVAVVFSVVLFAGLAIALAALDNLFGVSVPDRRYGELWVLVAGLFAPWFFLSGIPEDLDGLDKIEEYPKGLKIFSQYILMSLVVVYLVILYAYLIKILLQWSWPKGWVSSLILGFSATAIISLLLMHPIRDRSGNAWIQAAGKWLYIVIIPLIVVLFLAVTERIGDYGITESRYAGIALGIWLSAQVLYFLFSKSKSIKFTIGSLCLLVFLVSLGPWGILGLSENSQVGRLRNLLLKNGILVGGKIQKEHGSVSREDAQDINSIIKYLEDIHGYDAIQPWFSEQLKEVSKRGFAQSLVSADVLSKMRVIYIATWGVRGGRSFTLNPLKPADISGFDRILWLQYMKRGISKPSVFLVGEGLSYAASDNLRTLTISIGDAPAGMGTVQVDIGSFVDKLLQEFESADFQATNSMTPESMSLVAEQNGRKVKLIFQYLHADQQKGKAEISSYNFYIAYTVRK
jgi:hypothetical protein